MTRKLLNKHFTFFLNEPFAENIMYPVKYNKKCKRLTRKNISKEEINKKHINENFTSAVESFSGSKLEASNWKKITNWPNDPKNIPWAQAPKRLRPYFFLSYIKGEGLSTNIKKAESHIIKQFFANNKKKIADKQNIFSTQHYTEYPLNIPSSHFLFSLDQIRSERLEQARVSSSKGMQNKSYSEFKNQLRECKKVRLLYGHLSKRDLQKSLIKVQESRTLSSENLLIYLETRLDVILERCGFFSSIKAARQSIIHGRIQINFKVIKIPSYQLKPGDVIRVIGNKSNCMNIPTTESNVAQVPIDKNIEPVCFLTLLSQTHNYFQSILSLLSLLIKSKSKKTSPHNIEKISSALIKNSSALHLEDKWRFNSPPYFISSILEIQSVLYSFVFPWVFAVKPHLNLLSLYKSVSNHRKVILPTAIIGALQHYALKKLSLSETINSRVPAASMIEAPIGSAHRSCIDTTFQTANQSIKANEKGCLHFEVKKSTFEPNVYSEKGQVPGVANTQKLIWNTRKNVKRSFLNLFVYWLEIKNKLLFSRQFFLKEVFSIRSDTEKPDSHVSIGAAPLAEKSIKKIDALREFGSMVLRTNRCKHPCIDNTFFPISLEKNQTYLEKKNRKKTSTLFPSIQTNYLQKESKPIHLEISYSTLCAIFLYPPQQVYFSAIIDVDLITKWVFIKKK